MTRPPDVDAARRGDSAMKLVAVVAIGVAAVVYLWPGYALTLVPAVRAAAGQGTPGVVRLTEVHSGKGSVALGDFTGDDGRLVLRDRVVEIHGCCHEAGDSLRARYVPTPRSVPGSRPPDVYLASGSLAWFHPAVVTAVWLALLTWAAWRLRKRLRRNHPAGDTPP